MFHLGALRPCMHTHNFSLVEDVLYLSSYQRSSDWCLGTTFNMIQVYTLLRLMAQITGNVAATGFHNNVNCHIYNNQLPLVPTQLARTPGDLPKLHINPDIKTLEDVLTWVTMDDFEVSGYNPQGVIKYPFTE